MLPVCHRLIFVLCRRLISAFLPPVCHRQKTKTLGMCVCSRALFIVQSVCGQFECELLGQRACVVCLELSFRLWVCAVRQVWSACIQDWLCVVNHTRVCKPPFPLPPTHNQLHFMLVVLLLGDGVLLTVFSFETIFFLLFFQICNFWRFLCSLSDDHSVLSLY